MRHFSSATKKNGLNQFLLTSLLCRVCVQTFLVVLFFAGEDDGGRVCGGVVMGVTKSSSGCLYNSVYILNETLKFLSMENLMSTFITVFVVIA